LIDVACRRILVPCVVRKESADVVSRNVWV